MDLKKSSEISTLAEVVRESLELRVPIDIVEAVNRLGGTVKEVETAPGEPEATVRRTGERFEITIKKNHLPARNRFSVAHELGHLFIHMGYLVNPDTWGHSSEYCDSVYHRFGFNIEEAEANLFAAAFLMPEEEFRRAANELRDKRNNPVKELANHFKTSASATLKRGQELGVFRVNANGFK
ncbi:MAG: ImmA/IrrE family metallo-endopeptidase [Verrucomicrobiales bacterium]|nr:ImmA/IrrE family metallo-endopeptidase [Verrucomicrobiales bacterium]